jgi:hypothetical protein
MLLKPDDIKKLISRSLSNIIDEDFNGNLTLFNNLDQDKRCAIFADKIRLNFIKLFPNEDVDEFMSSFNVIAVVLKPVDNDGAGGYTSSVDGWGMFGGNEFKGWG